MNSIIEVNSAGESANPIVFNYKKTSNSNFNKSYYSDNNEDKVYGDFDGDGQVDFLKYQMASSTCVEYFENQVIINDDGLQEISNEQICKRFENLQEGVYLYKNINVR